MLKLLLDRYAAWKLAKKQANCEHRYVRTVLHLPARMADIECVDCHLVLHSGLYYGPDEKLPAFDMKVIKVGVDL